MMKLLGRTPPEGMSCHEVGDLRRGTDFAVTEPNTQPPIVPAWSSTIDGCRRVIRGVTFRTCARLALIVGTILTLVNQGAVIIGGDPSVATWLRVGVNYLVPFVVSSIGYLAPFRCRPEPDQTDR